MKDETTFGQWLSASRRAAGFSQRQFAELIGILDPIIVNDLEHDRIDPAPYVHRIASHFNAEFARLQTLAGSHKEHAARREAKQRSIEAGMLAFRVERGTR